MGTLAQMPWREADGRIYGPGVLDMKVGVMMALEAVRVLREQDEARPVTLLLNSDEEVGSPVSRAITEKLALQCAAVFVMEPAQGLAYKTARKGVGHFQLKVTGVGAHAGVDYAAGHSAVLEMARLVERVSAFTDLSKGLTVNVGVINGGTRSNVIASECRAEVDVRIVRASGRRPRGADVPCAPRDRQSLPAGGERWHQPSAHGTQSRHRGLVPPGPQAGRWNGLHPGRSRYGAAGRTATSPPPSGCPRWTAWAPSGPVRTPRTNTSCASIL